MKKPGSNTRRVILAASAAVAIPMLATSAVGQVRTGSKIESSKQFIHVTIKMGNAARKVASDCTIAGIDGSHTIFRKKDGSMFYLDPITGDIKPVSPDATFKFFRPNPKGDGTTEQFASPDLKAGSSLSLLGVDEHSNVIMQNTRGEKFYIDQKTGNMVFVELSGK